jgi:hypothetical protein
MSSIKITVENFDFYVTPDYLSKIDYKKFHAIELIKDHDLFSHIHNDHGPAIINLDNNEINYVLNGRPATEEEIERIKHNKEFNNNLTAILKEKT